MSTKSLGNKLLPGGGLVGVIEECHPDIHRRYRSVISKSRSLLLGVNAQAWMPNRAGDKLVGTAIKEDP